MSIVRKFQAPDNKKTPPKAVSSGPPQADFHLPEVNTDFADNLFKDPSFVDRFDASFSQTVPMDIAAETKGSPAPPADDWNLLEIEFPTKNPIPK